MKKMVLAAVVSAAATALYGGNLVPGDTSFETEPDTLTSGNMDPGYLPFAWDSKEAFHGKRSLRVDWDGKNRFGEFRLSNQYWLGTHLGFDTADLENGKKYVLSFYAKAERDGMVIRVMMFPNASWEYANPASYVVRKNIPLTREWKRITVPFTAVYREPAPFKGYSCLFGFNDSKAGKYWFDAIQVEPGDNASAYQPSTPMHCGIRLNVPEGQGEIRNTLWAAFYPSDQITGMLRIRSNDGKGGKLTVRTIDWLGKTVSGFSRDNVTDCDIPLVYDSKLRGWFKTTASITRGGKEIVRHSANFMVIDPPVETAPGVSPFFGMISHFSMLPLMKRIGVKAFQVPWISQCWKTRVCYGFEPEKGKYDFRSMDLQVSEAKKYGMRIKLGCSAMYAPEWYFTPEEVSEAKKYPPSINGLVSRASMDAWKKRVAALLERYGDKIDYIEFGGEDDGRLGANSYYMVKHPEWVVDGKVCQGEAFDLLTGTAAELGDMVRKKYPRLKVSPIRPAGGVGGDPWTYVEKAFDRVGKHFNEFGIDCYLFYPYHIGPDIKSVIANLDGREWTWNRIQNMIRRNGGHHKVYMSEAGLRVDTRFPDESKWRRKQAELQAKDFLISRALGIYAYFLFDAVGGLFFGQYHFTMQQNHRMQIPLPAVCQAARLVENSVKTRYIRQPGAGRITLFRKYDGSGTAGIWAERGYFFQPADPKALTVMDMMGNKFAPDKEGKYALGTAPLLISGPKYEAMEDSILKGEIGQSDFCRVFCGVKRKDTLTIELENTSSRKDQKIKLDILSGAGEHGREFTLPAGGYRQITFPARGPKAELTIRNLDTNAVIKMEKELPKPIPLTAKPLQFAMVSERLQMVPSDPWAPWHGPDDLSAAFSASWDERDLLVEVRVRDDLHYAEKLQPWNCDSVQIAIDPRSDGGFMKTMDHLALQKVIFEACAALSVKDGRQIRAVSFGRKDLIDSPGACVISRDEAKKETLYRFRLPWTRLGVQPEKGRVFGMSLAIFDDDTGKGKEILTEVGGGIIGKKDPRKYLKFVLE